MDQVEHMAEGVLWLRWHNGKPRMGKHRVTVKILRNMPNFIAEVLFACQSFTKVRVTTCNNM